MMVSLNEMKNSEQPWISTWYVFGCPECAENGLLCAVGFSHRGWVRFGKNELLMECPKCGYTRPQYMQKTDVDTGNEKTVNLWIPIYLPSLADFVDSLQLIREPTFKEYRGRRKFLDDLKYSTYNNWPNTGFIPNK